MGEDPDNDANNQFAVSDLDFRYPEEAYVEHSISNEASDVESQKVKVEPHHTTPPEVLNDLHSRRGRITFLHEVPTHSLSGRARHQNEHTKNASC